MLIGRSTDAPEVKTIESNNSSVINFVIATNRKFKNKEGNLQEEAEYHRCVAYGNSADILWQYLHKGKKMYVEWRLRTRKRTDNAWVTKYSTEIVINHFIFLDSKSDSQADNSDLTNENDDHTNDVEDTPF